MGRENSFSYEGKKALFDYLEQLEEDCDMEIELDVIALDCEYVEYADFAELQGDYDNIDSIEKLRDYTQVIELDNGGLIIAQF